MGSNPAHLLEGRGEATLDNPLSHGDYWASCSLNSLGIGP